MTERNALLTALGTVLGCALYIASCAQPAAPPASACATGQTSCGQSCVNTASDSNNCGACGTKCTTGQSCQSGSCQCLAGFFKCGISCGGTSGFKTTLPTGTPETRVPARKDGGSKSQTSRNGYSSGVIISRIAWPDGYWKTTGKLSGCSFGWRDFMPTFLR